MEKKLITEINQIRKMMGLNLLNEAGLWADVIGRMLGGATKSEVELLIGRGLKKILITDIENALTKAASGSAMKKGEIDILKALDAEIKKTVNTLGAVNAKGLKGIFEKAANDAIAAGDIAKSKILKKQMKQIDSSLKTTAPSTGSITNTTSKTTQNAGVTGQAASAGRSKLNSTADNATIASGKKGLQDLQSIAKEFKQQFPEAFASKDADIALKNAAKELEGKSFNEARQWIESRLSTMQNNIKQLTPKEQKTLRDYMKQIVGIKTHMGELDFGGTIKGIAGRIVGTAALTGWLYSAYESSVQNPEMGVLGNLTSGAFDQVSEILGGAVQGSKKGFEKVKQEVDTPAPDPNVTPVVTPPGGDTNTKDNTNTGGGSREDKKEKKSSDDDNKSSGDTDLTIDDF